MKFQSSKGVPIWKGPFNTVLRASPNTPSYLYKIKGVTRDATGAALPNCIVDFYYSGTKTLIGTITSDASGNYSFGVAPNISCYAVAYLPGSPDRSGTTVNTLVSA